MIYTTFKQWKDGNFLELGEPRKKAYSKDELALIEMGWNYGYDAGQASAIERNKEIYKQLDETEKSLDEAVRVAVEAEREKVVAHALKIARNAIGVEREACAKVADEWVHAYEHPSKVIAETIRKRGQA